MGNTMVEMLKIVAMQGSFSTYWRHLPEGVSSSPGQQLLGSQVVLSNMRFSCSSDFDFGLHFVIMM